MDEFNFKKLKAMGLLWNIIQLNDQHANSPHESERNFLIGLLDENVKELMDLIEKDEKDENYED